MTLEHAQQLIEALYSGDFKQTKAQLGRIRNSEWHYCCLGVAVKIFDLPHKLTHCGLAVLSDYDHTFYYLPTDNPIFKTTQGKFPPEYSTKHESEPEEYFSLANLNDLGFTFAEIADILTIFILEGIIDQL